MLTIKKISGSDAAVDYYAKYAQEKGESKGYWLDQTGAIASSGSEVDPNAMLNLLKGFTPDGQKSLCQNSGDGHSPGWDLTFSPPKSVSIAWSNAPEDLRDQIEDAHKVAVAASLKFINEEAIKVRVGKGGSQLHDAKMVAALFQHSSNRAEEPQLHTHAIVFNVAQSNVDQKWRTLHPYPMYRAYMAAGALYKAELAHQMRSLGFEIQRTKDSFELSQVPAAVCEAQSSRSKAIEDALSQQGLTRSSASAVTKELFALGSRAEKGSERIVRDFERWQKENASIGFGPGEQAIILMDGRENPAEHIPFSGRGCDDVALDSLSKLTEKSSTFNTYDLYRAIADASIGEISAEESVSLTKQAKKSDNLIFLGPNQRDEIRYSTKDMAEIEQGNMLNVAQRKGEGAHQVPEETISRVLNERPTIRREQADALRHLVSGRDGVAFIEGDAGTGKSFLMNAVKEAYQSSGYDVRGISFTNKAAKNLEDGSGIKNCQSVDSLLIEHRKGQNELHSKSILILDEAGMLDSRKMKAILDICRDKRAKLICVGDQKQIQPIAAGQAFGSMKKTFGGKRLSEIMRQKDEWLKTAIKDFSEGRAKSGLDELDKQDALNFSPNRQSARQSIIKDWTEQIKTNGIDRAPLIVVTTNNEVQSLNRLAREQLVENGILDQGVSLSLEHGPANFAPGDRIVFTSNFKKKGIYNSAVATIEKIKAPSSSKKPATMTVKTESGRRVKFELSTFNSFRHAYAITAHKSQGSTVDKVMVLVDGPLMDREKFYVSVSRGRQRPMVYADHQTLGDLSFEDRKKLSALSPDDRSKAERELFKASLAKMLGLSHEKDTSQDYSISRRELSLALKQSPERDQNPWQRIKSRVSEQIRALQERISHMIHDHSTQERQDVGLNSSKSSLEKGASYER